MLLGFLPPSSAERAVKVYQVGADGALALKETSSRNVITDTEALIDDFEDEDPKNYLGGESGSWNMDPYDEAYSVKEEIVEEGGGENPNRALKITYDVDGPGAVELGYWSRLMDFDATNYDHLVLDVRGNEAEGFSSTFMIELKKYKDPQERVHHLTGTAIVKNLTSEWQTIQIPFNSMTGLFDKANPKVWENPLLSRTHLHEFVINLQSRRLDQKAGAIYIDNLRFVRTGDSGPSVFDRPQHEGLKTPVRLEGVEYMKFLVKRLGGFPEEVLPEKEFPADDRQFLMTIAQDTWRFFDEVVDQEHHLPLDTIQLGESGPISEGGWIGDYTNVTNIGLYLACLVSAYDFGFLSREEAIARIRLTLETIDKMERHESGFLYNYYDTTLLKRTEYFVSLVDSGWLAAGIYVVKNAFPEELAALCDKILARQDFGFFYDPVRQLMTHGYYENLGKHLDFHYGVFYSEARLSSYIAIGRGEVPVEHWFHLYRTFPEDYAWTTQMPKDRDERELLGHRYFGGYYEWKGIQFVPSWGGSMFEALMPTLMIDEAKYAPQGLGLNHARHVEIQIKYALEELGYPVWGMSPSSVPEGGYSEYGVKVLGALGYKPGVVTPHAVVLALEYAPDKAIKNLRELVTRYPIYGEYGFYDAVTVSTGKVAYKYLALDQAMILIALNNYLNNGAIRRRFHQDPVNEKALSLLTEEKFFENHQESRTQ